MSIPTSLIEMLLQKGSINRQQITLNISIMKQVLRNQHPLPMYDFWTRIKQCSVLRSTKSVIILKQENPWQLQNHHSNGKSS